MDVIYNQIDNMKDSTTFSIVMVGIGIIFVYLVIREARKEPK